MSARSDYATKWGNEPPGPDATQEQRDDWETLPDIAKDAVKNLVPIFTELSEEQQDLFNNILNDIEAGSPVDTERLSKLVGEANITPQVRNFFFNQVGALLSGRDVPDFQEVFRAEKRALGVSLDEQVQQIQNQAARRGVLGSSSTAAAVGGAIGGFSQSIASLLGDVAQRQEQARSTRFRQGLNLAGLGLDIQQQGVSNEFQLAQLQNQLFLQDIGLQSGALDFLTNQQMLENQFNLGVGGFPHDPLTTQEVILPALTTGFQAIETFG